MNNEIQALIDNKTWVYTPLPLGKKDIGCKWVYKTMFHVNGSIECHKARLVAQGFTKVEGIYFFDTFSLVAKLTTIRLILSLDSSLNLHLHQLDVHNAFFHNDLDEEVYMEKPKACNPLIQIKFENY